MAEQKSSENHELKTLSFENSQKPYELDVCGNTDDHQAKSQGNDESLNKEVQHSTEEIELSSQNTSEKKNKLNNFYSYNPPPIPIVKEKKIDPISIQTKQNTKNKEIIEPKESDIKDIVFDEEIEEVDEQIIDRKKPRKKPRREEIEILESDDDEDLGDKNSGNEIEITDDKTEEKAFEKIGNLMGIENFFHKKEEKKVEKNKKKNNDGIESFFKMEEEKKVIEEKKEEKKEGKKEDKRQYQIIEKKRVKDEPDAIVQNFEKEIMKKIRANTNKNNQSQNNTSSTNKQSETKPKKLEERLNVEDSEGLSKEETVIQYLIQSLDTSNISNLLSKLAPGDDTKKKYARKNKKSLFQVTDANGKKIKTAPSNPGEPQQKVKKLTKKEREKDPNVINQKNIFNSILLTSLMKQYGYDAIAEAIVKTKNTEEEYEKNDLDEFIECILKTTTYNSLIHSLIQCKTEADKENEEKKRDEPQGLDAQINNYLNYKIKERREKNEQTKDIDIIVAPDIKKDKSEESVHFGRRKRRRRERNADEEEGEEIVLLNEPQNYSLRNKPQVVTQNDDDIDIVVDQDDDTGNRDGDESYEMNGEENEQEQESPDYPYQIIKRKMVTDNQKIVKEKKLGMHYHLCNDGHIYKYYHQHLKDGDKVVYECSDPVCKSKGIYYMNEQRFEVISNHVGYWSHQVLLRSLRKDKFFDLMKSKGYKDMHLSRANGTTIEWAN